MAYAFLSPIKNAIVVDVHAPRKAGLGLPLHLNMDQRQALAAIAPPDFHEFIGQAGAQGGITHDLLQLRPQALVAMGPINLGVGM